MNPQLPRPETAAWAAQRLGGPCRFARRGERVWAAWSESGRQAVLKEPGSRRKHEQERRALAEWGPRVPGVLPGLLGSLDDPPALLIEALPGLTGERALGSWELEVAAHRAAGAALGRLQALELPDGDHANLSEALTQRLEQWLALARPLLTRGIEGAIRERFGDGTAFDGLRRVPCHRDLEPRNWMVELDENRLLRLRFIDLEHARLDCSLVDLAKLECGAWVGRPELRAEFLEGRGGSVGSGGRGGTLGESDEDRLARLVILHLVATLVRASADGETVLAEQTRRALELRLSV